MKRQLPYRIISIAVGIVVALFIVLTMWTHTFVFAPKVDRSSGKAAGLKPIIEAVQRIRIDF